jgi:hypothetical protein
LVMIWTYASVGQGNKMLIPWHCPICNARNVDDTEATAIPMCENCNRNFFWESIHDFGLENTCEECGGTGIIQHGYLRGYNCPKCNKEDESNKT